MPAYSGKAYTSVNGNVPYFSAAELATQSFETYSDLDSLGRCGVTYACIGKDLMPTEERGSIGMVKPTGWHLSLIHIFGTAAQGDMCDLYAGPVH